MTDVKPLLTLAEISALLGVSVQLLRRHIRTGLLGARRDSTRYLVTSEEFERYREAQRARGARGPGTQRVGR